MEQKTQGQANADILSFPPISRQDDDLLQTVLNNLAQGVLLFDLETRLIFCNPRYLEMYRLPAELARPGRYSARPARPAHRSKAPFPAIPTITSSG